MAEFLSLLALSAAPAAGGALAWHLLITRSPRARRAGMAVGQIPLAPRRHRMAVRREVAHV